MTCRAITTSRTRRRRKAWRRIENVRSRSLCVQPWVADGHRAELVVDPHAGQGAGGGLRPARLAPRGARQALATPARGASSCSSTIPWFLKSADEPDQYFNIPIVRRTPLLQLFRESGVRLLVSGHLSPERGRGCRRSRGSRHRSGRQAARRRAFGHSHFSCHGCGHHAQVPTTSATCRPRSTRRQGNCRSVGDSAARGVKKMHATGFYWGRMVISTRLRYFTG